MVEVLRVAGVPGSSPGGPILYFLERLCFVKVFDEKLIAISYNF